VAGFGLWIMLLGVLPAAWVRQVLRGRWEWEGEVGM